MKVHKQKEKSTILQERQDDHKDDLKHKKQDILRKYQLQEAEKRFHRHQMRKCRSCWRLWKAYLRVQKRRRKRYIDLLSSCFNAFVTTLERKKEEEALLYNAAVTIQRIYRGHLGYRIAKQQQQEQRLYISAVITIQNFWRRLLSIRVYRLTKRMKQQKKALEDKAANCIQKAWKRWKGKKMAEKRKQELEMTKRFKASLKIQFWWRRKHQSFSYHIKMQAKRFALLQREEAAKTVQKWWQKCMAKKHFASQLIERTRRELAAERIQSIARGYVERQRIKRFHVMARKIQGKYRTWKQNMISSAILTVQLQIRCALKIQCTFRMHICKKQARYLRRRRNAARSIQRAWRSLQHYRKECEKLWIQWAAILIQRIWRGWNTRKSLARRNEGMIIFAAERGDFATVQWALDAGFSHVVDESGDTILHAAVRSGNKRVIKLCLRYGLSLELKNVVIYVFPTISLIYSIYFFVQINLLNV